MRAVDSRVSDIGIDARGYRRDPQLERRNGRLRSGPLRRKLIHGDAVAVQVDAQSFGDRGAGQIAGGFDVVPFPALCRLVPEIGRDDQLTLEIRERLKSRRERKLLAFAFRSEEHTFELQS